MRREWRVRSLRLPLVRTLECDNPWKFSGSGRQGGVRKRYPAMTVEQLKRFPLPPLADDVRMFQWRVGAMQEEALEVGKAWGFTQKSEIVWIKTTADGKLILDLDGVGNHEVVKGRDELHGKLANIAFGCGHQVRYSHEVCLIWTRGNPERTEHFRSVFFAPIGEHSEKPDKFYQIAERMSPGPRHRLFAMGHRDGWTSEYQMAHRGEHAQPVDDGDRGLLPGGGSVDDLGFQQG